MYKHILVPVDGSETSFKAAREALQLAKLFGSKVIALYVVDLRKLEEYEEAEKEQAKRKLREFGVKALERIEDESKKFDVVFESMVKEGNPSEVIVETADQLEVELIVIGTRGLTGLKRMVLGSTAYRVVEWANCQVLVVK
ncbi:MAG: universal stress protein [Candidatus Hecatellales archaeon]|nr:MAG: universal stress protein [Candidatus Hecatellales archaeon]